MMATVRSVSFGLAAVLSIAARAARAMAFQPPAGQSEFVPASSLPPGDQLPAAPLLIAAYAFVWIAVLFYLWTIWRRVGKVEADMQALEHRLTHGGPSR